MRRAQTVVIEGPVAGIVPDLPPNAIDKRAWSDGLNARFLLGRVETSPGWLKFTSQKLADTVKNITHYFLLNNLDYVVAVTLTKAYYYDTVTDTWIDITGASPLSSDLADYIQADVAFDYLIFTNAADRIKKWTGTGNISDLLGLTTAIVTGGTVDVQSAKGLTAFSGFLHLVHTIEAGTRYGQRWRWSAFNQPETWNNTVTYGQAGYTDITDGSDKLQTCRRLGGDFVVLYKERSIHTAQYVGPPTVWGRRLVVNGIGLIAPGAVADLINEHVFISDDGIYVFNGLSIKSIGDTIFDTFITELDPDNRHLIWTHTIYEDGEVIFAYPTVGSDVPDKALVLNYKTGAWSFRDMPFTTMGYYQRTDAADPWDTDTEAWDDDPTRWDDSRFSSNAPQHLGGDVSGYVHDYGLGYSQDGSAHNSYVISHAIDAQAPGFIKRFQRVLVDLINTGSHNLEISYLTVNNPNEALNWSAAKNLPCDQSTVPWVSIDISGRYLFLRFRTNGTNNPWGLTKYGYDYIRRGYR